MRFIFFTTFFVGISLFTFASTDSLIIQGRILNLNGRLYRQAPTITFSRNNILQPQLELSKEAALAPDGSFRVSLPMLYKQEEIYLDYSGKAYTTFLGSPGTVEITFDGDSLKTAKKLFYFAGENADANNQYNRYVTEDAKALNANSALGAKFYETFWELDATEAVTSAGKRADLRRATVTKFLGNMVTDSSLAKWTESVIEDERLQNLFEYSLNTQLVVTKNSAIMNSLTRLGQPPLSAQKVTLANRFGNYADQMVDEKKSMNPTRTSSLPVRLMASLIRKNASKLTDDEISKLDDIASRGVAEKIELDFLNNLYAKNELVLNLLFNYERESRIYGDLFDSTSREFLKARYLPKNFYKYTFAQQAILSKHIQTRLTVPQFQQSLDEMVKIEVKDSVAIKQMIAFKDVKATPTEVLPGYLFSASNERGTTWLNSILDKYKGKTIYLIKWSSEDPKSREDMEYVAALQAQLPEDVVFLFLYIPVAESWGGSMDLPRQYIVRHRLKGTHLFLSSSQTMDLLFKLNPVEPGTYSIIKPNGKFYSKNAPAPSAMEKAIQTILDAETK